MAEAWSEQVFHRWFYKKILFFSRGCSSDFSHVRPLLNLGLQFFVLQLPCWSYLPLIKFLSLNFLGLILSTYDVLFKLFSVISIIYGLITAPLWS